jgi:hypothetical protein
MSVTRIACVLLVAVLALPGCSSVRKVFGLPDQPEPSVNIRSAEARWLLVKNPRFGDVASEPEYIWVEEDKVPTTLTTLIRGQRAIIARPEIVAKYGSPPGGGKISPRQGTPYQAAADSPRNGGRPAAPPSPGAVVAATTPLPAPEPVKRGYVVHVDTTRVVIDLTASDGVAPGATVSLRRDRVPIIHPVTGELLGELDEEVATARVVETRDRFSVAEIESVAPGTQVQVRDRVMLK